MKRWATLGGALALTLAVTACEGDRGRQTTANQANPSRDTSAVGTSGSTNLAADRDFVEKQLVMGDSEVALGQLAAQKGTHPEVKRFGEMMVRDHRAAGQELKRIHSQMAADTSAKDAKADAREDHENNLEELQGLSGRDFDKKYIALMIEDHEKDVRELERRAENGSAEVRQWASQTLPKVQQHLEQAKTIKETLDQAR